MNDMISQISGRVHSLQSLGTVDGPGVRFVVFLQGCNLRCKCCHNPDTWEMSGGTVYTAQDIVDRVLRCRDYFGEEGGITASGGEPLLQAEFVHAIFSLCHKNGINTCLDTSGSILNEEVSFLLNETDRVLLDIKYTTDQDYHEYVGCSIEKPLAFLKELDARQIPTTIRQVIVPDINDSTDNLLALKDIVHAHHCVDKIELLPFRKICQVKYNDLGLTFPFGHLPEPSREKMAELNLLLNEAT